ncbi:MAG: CSLREA domain-containing protein, partial [Chloroflexi bacterium]|nr:CSLREA domain-containing protein [Chloroflexota bacterium]
MKIRKGFAIGLGISQAIIIVSLLFWLLQHTPTIHAADWNVNTFIDTTDGSCNDGTCSLRDAISLSAPNDTVFLPAGSYVLSSTLGQIFIANTITLLGQGATPADTIIDGDNASRIFYITSGTITVTNLTLQNGQPSSGNGGAINTFSPIELTLDNAIIQESISPGHGGGIFLDSGTLNIINGSRILSNTAVVNNSSAGGGVYVNKGTVILSDSIVAGNIAQYGAGISLNQSNAQLTINNGQFLNNNGLAPNPRFPGGAINTGSGSVIMNSGLISGNTAHRGAGAMVDTGSFTLNGGTITDNESNYGGGVYIRQSSGLLTINGGSISGNRSIANIFGGGALYVFLGSVVQNGGEINDNTAVFLGGAMEVRFGSFQMNGGIISGNSANNWGGAIYN